jgi:hypothetical protein
VDPTELIAARTMESLYIWLDLVFLLAFVAVLFWSKRYQALVAGIAGGILYFLIDWGVFYRLLGTRVVRGADPLWFLLWLSMSYGLTNFAWIWLWLDRDRRLVEWSVFIVAGWIWVAIMSQVFGYDETPISISRGTSNYHGVFALLLFLGYGILCVYNLRQTENGRRAPLLWILAIGILVQLSWEAVLAISGIRNLSWNTFIVNSLLETNMGLPYLYMIHRLTSRRWNEQLQRRAPDLRAQA